MELSPSSVLSQTESLPSATLGSQDHSHGNVGCRGRSTEKSVQLLIVVVYVRLSEDPTYRGRTYTYLSSYVVHLRARVNPTCRPEPTRVDPDTSVTRLNPDGLRVDHVSVTGCRVLDGSPESHCLGGTTPRRRRSTKRRRQSGPDELRNETINLDSEQPLSKDEFVTVVHTMSKVE